MYWLGNTSVRHGISAAPWAIITKPDTRILLDRQTYTDMSSEYFNTLRPRQDGRRFPDDTFECIFLKENVIILIKISLKFVLKGPINNIPALVQIMAWRRSGDKPLSEPMMVSLPTHICVTWPQWVNCLCNFKPNASPLDMSKSFRQCFAHTRTQFKYMRFGYIVAVLAYLRQQHCVTSL